MLTSWLKQNPAAHCPGNDVLRKVFGDRSILLLLDEFLFYVGDGVSCGDSTFGRQVLTFVQKLTEVVRDPKLS